MSRSKAKILRMRLMKWLSRKNEHPLKALYSAFSWGGCTLLCCGMVVAIASADIQSARAAEVQSIGERSPATQNGRYIVIAKPADKFPQRAQFRTGGALNGFFLRPNRKPCPYNASAPAAMATWLYLVGDRERLLSPAAAPHRPIDHRDIYLRCCSLLI